MQDIRRQTVAGAAPIVPRNKLAECSFPTTIRSKVGD